MLGNLLAYAKDHLNLIKDWVSANLLIILMAVTVSFIFNLFLSIFSRGMLFILKLSLKWANIFFKGLGVLTIILLMIVILRTIFCLVSHERYATLCPPAVVTCQKGCVKDPELEETDKLKKLNKSSTDKVKESSKSRKGNHSKEAEKKKKDP